MYSEYSAYYEACRTGWWACEDETCPCGGRGWWLSQLDTWHRCPVHGGSGPHPESLDDEFDGWEGPVQQTAPEAPLWGEDDIPF